MNLKFLWGIGIVATCLISQLPASTIAVGSDGSGPLGLYSTEGALTGTFGPAGGGALTQDGTGGIYIATPNDSSSVVSNYDPSQNLLSSFIFTAALDMRAYASYIIDMTRGIGNTLWISTYSGGIYQLSSSGTVLSSFDSGTTAPGIAFDGNFLYTTSGPGFSITSPYIYQRNASGEIINTINTGLNDTLGLAVDPTGFWVGGFDSLFQIASNGTILNSYAIDGVHYGVEAVDIGAPVDTVPEPSSLILAAIGVAVLVFWKARPHARAILAIVEIISAGNIQAAISISSVVPAPASPQPVGSSITFTVSALDSESGQLRYRFRIRPAGGTFTVLRDYSPTNKVTWTPSDTEGSFEIESSVMNRTTHSVQSQSTIYALTSRVSGETPVVSSTNHPLVALYSGPSCPAGSSMRVRFKLPSDVVWQSTQLKSCNGSTSMNFYVAGMRASSQYQLRQDVIAGPRVVSGPTLTFTTGIVPVALSSANALKPLPPSSATEGVTIFTGLASQGTEYSPFAVDAGMNVIWYAPTSQVYMTRPVPSGGYLVVYGFTTDLGNSGFRQYDVAGNLVQETNVERMNDQLSARSMNPATTFHHEVRKLANGNYLLLAMTERMSTAQGGLADIAGDMILILDSNMQLLWAWDSFDHLDVTRAAVLGETCNLGPGGCVLFNASTAKDWLHGNSVALAPDGNLVYSARHQDFVYKIAYENGIGDGHMIWRLGKGGDFTWNSTDPWPWFSHQHDAEYEDAVTMSIFDDGNTRVRANGGNSRGQGLILNEVNRTVSFALNADLGSYSFALGSAQRLLNGNYVFDNGWINVTSNAESSEWSTSGALVSNVHSNSVNYRTFRLRDLFSAPY